MPICIFSFSKKILKLYLIWTLIYLPLSIYGSIYVYHYSIVKGLLKYLLNILLVGENYNSWILWYLLSALYALLLFGFLLKNNLSLKTSVIIGFCIYLSGIVFDTLIKFFPNIFIIKLFAYTFHSGRLFTGFGFIGGGLVISNCKIISKKLSFFLFLIFYMLFSFLSKSIVAPLFMFAASFFFFIFIISLPDFTNNKQLCMYFRISSSVLYFIHLWVWTFYYIIRFHEKTKGFECFFMTVLISMLCASVWFYLKRTRAKYKSKKEYKLSFFYILHCCI